MRCYGNFPKEGKYWFLLLWLAAIVVFGSDLGGVPLRDWDEGIVAQVAREMYQSASWEGWLYPTIDGAPYLNKPPLFHWLVALTYTVVGVGEASTRFPGAMLAAFTVPMVYAVGKEIFARPTPAILGAWVYLTLLPVVRHGRLAMLDGAVACFWLLLLWCLLRSRRDGRYALGVGLSLGAIAFTKGIVAILLAAIAGGFLLWDTPRLLGSRYLWLGLLLGTTPVLVWYLAQWQHYGSQFSQTLATQFWERLWKPVENHAGPPWYYAEELLKYTFPWLLFFPDGIFISWKNRLLSWGKLILVWTGGYFLAVSAMGTKLPWYLYPFFGGLALAVGVVLARIWASWTLAKAMVAPPDSPQEPPWRSRRSVWMGFLLLLAVAGWGGSVYFAFFAPPATTDPLLPVVTGALALTLTGTFWLLWRENRQFILILGWGMYVSLVLFVHTDTWLWELNEAYPVKPVAAMLQNHTPADATIYTSYPYHRPSLNFYSDRTVIPKSPAQLQQHWQQTPYPYLLVAPSVRQELSLPQSRLLGISEGWQLLGKSSP